MEQQKITTTKRIAVFAGQKADLVLWQDGLLHQYEVGHCIPKQCKSDHFSCYCQWCYGCCHQN